MEIQLKDLFIFESYRDRQVILNYYTDEDFLWKRDGFFFDSVKWLDNQLVFMKNNERLTEISLNEYSSVHKNTDFQHYYSLRNNQGRLDIYFP